MTDQNGKNIDRLNEVQIKNVQNILIQICEHFKMEFAVLAMQNNDGPLEIFRVHADEKWNEIGRGLSEAIKKYAATAEIAASINGRQPLW